MVMTSGAAQAQTPDWTVGIDDSVTPALSGGEISIPISVGNNSFVQLEENTIEIVVPPTTTFTSFSGDITGCSPLPAGELTTVTCDVPVIPVGAPAVELLFGITTTTAGTPPITATVAATNAAGQTDVNATNSTATKTLTFDAGADISLDVVVPATAASGEIIDIVFTAANAGPNDAGNLVLVFTPPSGLENFVAPANCALAAGVYECTVSALAVGDDVDFTFSAQVTAASSSTIETLASISADAPEDPTTENNLTTGTTTVTAGSDVVLSKSIAGADPLLVGDTTSFTLLPSYTGDVPTNLTIQDTVPSNYTVTGVTVVSGGWDCSFTPAGVVECTLASGTVAGTDVSLGEITIDVSVDSVGVPENVATILSPDVVDPQPFNNTDGDGGVTIEEPFIDLAVRKSGIAPALFVVGEEYEFDLGATNEGNADYIGTVEIRDIVPAGFTVTGAVGAGWVCTPATLVGDGATPLICTAGRRRRYRQHHCDRRGHRSRVVYERCNR